MRFKGITRLCLLIFLGSAIGCAVYGVVDDFQRSKIVHQLDYEEGNILNTAVRITHGLTPYPDPHGWPVVINPYGPLPYYLTAIPVRLFGPSFAPARFLIIMAAVICALLVGLLVYQFTRSTLLGASFGGLFLSHRITEAWMPVLRVDFIALTLALLGLYIFARYPRRPWISAILLAIAVFTKFSFLAAPGACLCCLLLQKQWKRAGLFTAAGIASLAVFFGTAILVTHRGFAYDVFLTEGSSFSWSLLVDNYRYVIGSDPFIVVLGLIAVLWAIKTWQIELPVVYLIFALMASFTAAKAGSNMNHLIEFIAAFCIGSGWLLGQMLQRGTAMRMAASGLCVVLAAWMLLLIPYAPNPRPVPGCAAMCEAIAKVQSDRILSENIGLLVVNRKTVWVSNPFAYQLLSNSGKAPDTPLQQRIREKWFDYIILGADPHAESTRWSPAVRQAIIDNYVFIGRFPCRDAVLIYAPAAPPAPKP